jgi:formylglycine-generating enzyme required for sulfatase activity
VRRYLLLLILVLLVGCGPQHQAAQDESKPFPSPTSPSARQEGEHSSTLPRAQDPTVLPLAQGDPAADATPLDVALAGVQRNAAWQPHAPYTHTFDGVEMVLVPAGCFLIGDARNENHQCFAEPFWIDRYEISQATFTRLGGKQAAPPAFVGASLPVENITWREARAFCESRQAALPTEREWEYAARGVDGWTYPWGNAWEHSLANGAAPTTTDPYTATAPVNAFPAGASWVGSHQMSGNVWEWVRGQDDLYDEGVIYLTPTPPELMYRGGSYINDNELAFQTTYRFPQIESGDTGFNVGFRCARPFAADEQ